MKTVKQLKEEEQYIQYENERRQRLADIKYLQDVNRNLMLIIGVLISLGFINSLGFEITSAKLVATISVLLFYYFVNASVIRKKQNHETK